MRSISTKRASAHQVIFLCLALLGAALTDVRAGTNITVTSQFDSGPGSLRQAIASAGDGGTISFDHTLNNDTIVLSTGDLLITNSITITGPGAGSLTISGNGSSRIFTITGNHTNIINGNVTNSGPRSITTAISGLTITGGNGLGSITNKQGGAIFNNTNSVLTLTSCLLSGNSGSSGGGVFNAGTLAIFNSDLASNTASFSGGGIANIATLTLSNSALSANSIPGTNGLGGGAIYSTNGTLTILSSAFTGNGATNASGGAIYNDFDSTGTIASSTLSSNTASTLGGGIANFSTLTISNGALTGNSVLSGFGGALYNAADPAAVTASALTSNSAPNGEGGGIYNDAGGALTVGGDTLADNTASGGSGGGILNAATVTLISSTLSNNSAAIGGGIANQDALTVTNSTLVANSALAGNGGGIDAEGGAATIVQSLILGNTATGHSGGGIDNVAEVTLSQSTLAGNNAATGGGIFNNNGLLTVSQSTVVSNSGSSAVLGGGAIRNSGGEATIVDSTFFANSITNGRGGALFNIGTMFVTESTFDNNSAQFGGGIFNFSGTLIVDSTVVANSLAGGNCTNRSGTFISQGHNLSDDASALALLNQSSDTNAVAAGLDPNGLQANGGPTLTIALEPGSPAIEAGGPVYPPFGQAIGGGQPLYPLFTDQRGSPRFACGRMDIGAFQLTQLTPAPVITLIGSGVITQECSPFPFVDPGVTASNTCGDALAVSAGFGHGLALTTDGSVVGWGDDTFGQTSVPAGLSNEVAAIAAGNEFSVALLVNGTVIGWGDNSFGQTNTPSAVSNVVAIAAGGFHGLALEGDGSVAGWGDDTHGQTNIPASVNNVVAIAAGGYHSLALESDGAVVGWGDNTYGQTNIPAAATNVVAIAAGGYHSLALLGDGTVIAWGAGTTNTGVSFNFGQSIVPPGLSNVVAIAAGGYHSLALQSGGTVVAWGNTDSGQIDVPAGLNDAVAIAAGVKHSLAIIADGAVIGWGLNTNSQTIAPFGLNADLTRAVTVSTNGYVNSLGTAVLTYSVVDAHGVSASVNRTVVTVTTNPPTINCPADIVATNNPSLCGATVFYTIPLGHNECTTAVTTQIGGLPDGSVFPVGVTTNTFLVTDGSGNTASCSFTVTVLDLAGPQISCPGNISLTTDAGQCTASNVTYTATVSCSNVTTVCVPPSGSAFSIGVSNVTCTATDAGGASNSCSFTVTVSDLVKPAVVCPGDIVTNAVSTAGTVVSFATPASTNSPCSGVTVHCAPVSGSTFPIGVTPVVCAAQDASGSGTSCSFNVTVFGPLDQLQNVLSQLITLDQSVTNKIDRKLLGVAVTNLTKAVADPLWQDDSHPDPKKGATALALAKTTTGQLDTLIKLHDGSVSVPTLQGFVISIVGATRSVAAVAISDATAAHANAKAVAQANTSLNKGDVLAGTTKPDTAIPSYESAWAKAVAALIKTQ